MKRSVNLSRQRKPPKVNELVRALKICGIGPAEAREILAKRDEQRTPETIDSSSATQQGK